MGLGWILSLQLFPWQLGFLDSHSLTNFSWWNPTWVAALRPFQSTVVFATQKTTKFSRGLRGFWWFSDGFLVPFPSIFRGFCAFSFHSLPVKSPPFSVFRKGHRTARRRTKVPPRPPKKALRWRRNVARADDWRVFDFGVGLAVGVYPLVMTNIAIEHDHRNSGFTHWKWWIFPWFSCW